MLLEIIYLSSKRESFSREIMDIFQNVKVFYHKKIIKQG